MVVLTACCWIATACTAIGQEREQVLQETIAGIPVTYDVRPAGLAETRRIMHDFTLAYINRDRAALKNILSEDFVWHVHDGIETERGSAQYGVDGMLEILELRSKNWSDTQYSEVELYATKTQIFQKFRVSGVDRQKGPFDTYGIDVYEISDGLILSKDSYWKRQPQSERGQ